MPLEFPQILPPEGVDSVQWKDWKWQMRRSLRALSDFESFSLSKEEVEGFDLSQFKIQTTPYYAELARRSEAVRRMVVPHVAEASRSGQHQLDPLGERKNQPVPRIIHRYSDRALFLVTDVCGVYCRYCTRKHFTGKEQAFVAPSEYEQALNYLRGHDEIREVLLSGGDPLTLSNSRLERILQDLRDIPHIEIIRIGSRMPVINPMRLDDELADVLVKYQPVFLMSHFNHPDEVTFESKLAFERMINRGILIFNQMVLLNGINNHPALIQALSRRLLYLRVKPYYMFQCDPSEGSEHLRTSIEESELLQRDLWGHLSGLAMPQLSLDVPSGGGKVGIVPDFEKSRSAEGRVYQGFDGVLAEYQNPVFPRMSPKVEERYLNEWKRLKQRQKTSFQPETFPG